MQKIFLIKSVKNYDVVVVRSRTKVTQEVIDANTKMRIIARVGVGLDNIASSYSDGIHYELVAYHVKDLIEKVLALTGDID